jgi:L-threonylcarbamoyladenylate synthase
MKVRKSNMNDVIKHLKKGGIIITPTDTVYGIMADAANDKAVKKVYEAKKRSFDKPLIVLVNSVEMLNDYVLEIDDITKRIIDKYWPGPLTILFKKNNRLSKYVSNNDYIGIRYPNNEIIINILNEFNKPVVSTSANISNNEVVTEVSMIPGELLEKVDFVLDGGNLSNESSTIIKVEDGKIEILREGSLKEKIIKEFK